MSSNSRERVGGSSHSVTITRESQKRMNQGFNHLQGTTDHISKVQICTTRDAWKSGKDRATAYTTPDHSLRSQVLYSLKRESVQCQEIVNTKWGHTLAMLKKLLIDTKKKTGKF